MATASRSVTVRLHLSTSSSCTWFRAGPRTTAGMRAYVRVVFTGRLPGSADVMWFHTAAWKPLPSHCRHRSVGSGGLCMLMAVCTGGHASLGCTTTYLLAETGSRDLGAVRERASAVWPRIQSLQQVPMPSGVTAELNQGCDKQIKCQLGTPQIMVTHLQVKGVLRKQTPHTHSINHISRNGGCVESGYTRWHN